MRRNISPAEVDKKLRSGQIRKRTARRYYQRLISRTLRERAKQEAHKGTQETITKKVDTDAQD